MIGRRRTCLVLIQECQMKACPLLVFDHGSLLFEVRKKYAKLKD
jgi:hypothetical protein